MADQEVPQKLAYTIDEYCAANGFCRATLYNLWRKGEGPRWMKIGSRRFISTVAADDYIRQREYDATNEGI